MIIANMEVSDGRRYGEPAMNDMFTNAIADTVQLFSLPLEVVGLALALIEVRLPTIAGKITTEINRFISDLLAENSTRAKLFVVWICSALLAATLRYIIETGVLGVTNLRQLIAVAVFFTLVLTVGIFFICDRWVPGRAIGTLGLILAGLGVLGEGYQVAVMLID